MPHGYALQECRRYARGKDPARFGQAGTGSISYVFANLINKIFDMKIKNVTGFGSGREIDLGMERGEADCRATSDITVIRPWSQLGLKIILLLLSSNRDRKRAACCLLFPLCLNWPSEAKPTVNLMDVVLAYTEFDRPFCRTSRRAEGTVTNIARELRKNAKGRRICRRGQKAAGLGRDDLSQRRATSKKDRRNGYPTSDIIKRVKEILEES